MHGSSARVQVVAVEAQARRHRPDRVATEEPMEIRMHGAGEDPRALAVTMRTPGNDFELAVGFCVAEGLLVTPDDLTKVEYCVGADGDQQYNVVTVVRRRPVGDELRPRPFAATAACGLCGTASLDDLRRRCEPVDAGVPVPWASVLSNVDALMSGQPLFARTGGVHAAATLDADGSLVAVREDVGRHNALDKVIGASFLAGEWPVRASGVALSGRIGFELVQKAAIARIGLVVALGAPSSLAVDTARLLGITLVGFVRDDRANIYTHPERLAFDHH